jgi:hypothetical protein
MRWIVLNSCSSSTKLTLSSLRTKKETRCAFGETFQSSVSKRYYVVHFGLILPDLIITIVLPFTQMESDLLSMPVKWLVLETPVPEELIVAAARLRFDGLRNGRVDCFCASSASGQEAQAAIMKRLLSKAETVCYSAGMRSCIVEAPQWRTDLEALYTECGYEELSGHIWPEARQGELLRPTMVLEFHKVFPERAAAASTGTRSTTSASAGQDSVPVTESGGLDAAARADSVLADLAQLQVVDGEEGAPRPVQVEGMPQLMKTLFAALHAEYQSAE